MPTLDPPYHSETGRTAMCLACEARLEASRRREVAERSPSAPGDEPGEVMLRPRFREWYPQLRTDQWYPARHLAELVQTQRRAREWRWRVDARLLSNEHFLFRSSWTRTGAISYTRSAISPSPSLVAPRPVPGWPPSAGAR
jgi:hypothetical protein